MTFAAFWERANDLLIAAGFMPLDQEIARKLHELDFPLTDATKLAFAANRVQEGLKP
jgi:hypothetical protein